MNRQAEKFYGKYQHYFMKVPSSMKELEIYVPFITPLFITERFSSKEFAIIIVTTIIQIIIYSFNIAYLNFLENQHKQNKCLCSKNIVIDYIYYYSLIKIIFLLLVIGLYITRFNNIMLGFFDEIAPLLAIISAVDLITLFPAFLYISDVYYNRLNYDRCYCSDSKLKFIPHTFSWIAVTSYTIIIAALLHSLITMIFAFVLWKMVFTK